MLSSRMLVVGTMGWLGCVLRGLHPPVRAFRVGGGSCCGMAELAPSRVGEVSGVDRLLSCDHGGADC